MKRRDFLKLSGTGSQEAKERALVALLKTLEEPPEHVKFIFATTETHKVPLTILSRCQRFDLRRIPANLIVPVIVPPSFTSPPSYAKA